MQVNKITLISVAIIAIVLIGAAYFVGRSIVRYNRVRCTDFAIYQKALDAYNKGATYLDKDGDGTPCNSLKK